MSVYLKNNSDDLIIRIALNFLGGLKYQVTKRISVETSPEEHARATNNFMYGQILKLSVTITV